MSSVENTSFVEKQYGELRFYPSWQVAATITNTWKTGAPCNKSIVTVGLYCTSKVPAFWNTSSPGTVPFFHSMNMSGCCCGPNGDGVYTVGWSPDGEP